jgi:3-dehydroquinate dehydratase-2
MHGSRESERACRSPENARPGAPANRPAIEQPFETCVQIAGNVIELDTIRQRAQTTRPARPAPGMILLLNGPNLDLLGTREPGRYGRVTLAEIERDFAAGVAAAGQASAAFQSNSELALIERIHAAKSDGTSFIVINPAAFTHTSVALRDALAAAAIPFIEVHLSNVHAREDFRRHSYLAPIAVGVIAGFGPLGYRLALEAALSHLARR